MKRYIFTGTPGSGKTSIIKEMKFLGHNTIDEAATDLIARKHLKGEKEPWKFPGFIDEIISLQKQREEEANEVNTTLSFYDRSPICTYALALYLKLAPSNILMKEIDRIQVNSIYEKRVFFTENLGFIVNTDARKITLKEALKFEQIHLTTYIKLGYKCLVIPTMSVEERVKFVLNNL